ncbi:MAG: DUF6174 domain-containing protein [Balneolaceae bacterium]|nr:DUF6174 domain-containing protein [Balneolaceae bacterium]
MHVRISIPLISITALFILAGCENNVIQSTGGEVPPSLQNAKQRWESLNIQHYAVEVEQRCFCGGPIDYRMTVRNGEVVEVVDLRTGEQVAWLEPYFTISDWFDWLEKAASRDPVKFDLEFNSQYGYPAFVDYDQSKQIADEEMHLILQNFQPL